MCHASGPPSPLEAFQVMGALMLCTPSSYSTALHCPGYILKFQVGWLFSFSCGTSYKEMPLTFRNLTEYITTERGLWQFSVIENWCFLKKQIPATSFMQVVLTAACFKDAVDSSPLETFKVVC